MDNHFDYKDDKAAALKDLSPLHSVKRRVCPLVSAPRSNCYCSSTNSIFVEPTIKFCGGDYESCEIYLRG